MNNELHKLREQIDIIDNEILTLLSKRIEVVKKIDEVKKKMGIQPFDKKRRDALLEEKIKKAKKLGIDETFIKKLFQSIHDHGVEIQKKLK